LKSLTFYLLVTSVTSHVECHLLLFDIRVFLLVNKADYSSDEMYNIYLVKFIVL